MFPKMFSKTKPGQKRGNTPGAQQVDAQDRSLSIESLAEGAESENLEIEAAAAKGRSYLESLYPDAWSTRFECMGELIVDRGAGPSDVVQVYKMLNEDLEADILYVNPTVRGMSIVCGIKDLGMFIDSIPRMPRLASWALIHG